MLHWEQIWKHMHNLTNMHIEKRAVMEIICYFEEQMDMVISQSARELEKRNKFHNIQGVKKKQRIDSECVREAIKTLNNNGHSSLSERTGGIIQKVKKKNETHPHENTEVV